MKTKSSRKFFYVYALTAKTDLYSPRNLYFINSQTQGLCLVEFGYSLATEFDTKKKALSYIPRLQEKYKGVKSFKLEYRKIEV